MNSQKFYVYVSSWETKKTKGSCGLEMYSFDSGTGTLTHVKNVLNGVSCNMSFVDQKRRVLYVLNETKQLPELRAGGGGRVLSFSLDPVTGIPEELGAVPTFCPAPSFATLDAGGDYMVVSNHSSNSVVCKAVKDAFGEIHLEVLCDDSLIDLFTVNQDGSIKKMVDVAYHFGSGPKHFHPRPHSAVMSPSGKLFAVCDKGTDEIYMYTIDRRSNKLVLASTPFKDRPGSSPRYCVFHPTLPYLIVNHEGDTIIEAFKYTENGELELVCSLDAAPQAELGYSGRAEQQDLKIHPNGKYIYDIVHGPEVVSVIQIDASGQLAVKQHQRVRGKWLRGCAVTPDEKYLLTACIEDGSLEAFRIDENGLLSSGNVGACQPGAAYISFFNPHENGGNGNGIHAESI